jgi:hypothetical protein
MLILEKRRGVEAKWLEFKINIRMEVQLSIHKDLGSVSSKKKKMDIVLQSMCRKMKVVWEDSP